MAETHASVWGIRSGDISTHMPEGDLWALSIGTGTVIHVHPGDKDEAAALRRLAEAATELAEASERHGRLQGPGAALHGVIR